MDSADINSEEVQHLTESVFLAAKTGDAETIKFSLTGLPSAIASHVLHRYATDGNVRETPLAVAAYYGHLEVVALLVEDYQVDMDQMELPPADNKPVTTTALTCAASRGHVEIVRYLVSRGCDVNLANSRGRTALFCSDHQAGTELAMFLVDSGANVNAVDGDGHSVLQWACSFRNSQLVQFLIDKGADMNFKTKNLWTALHYCASKNVLDLVKLLLENGAQITKSKAGRTPLLVAASSGCTDVVEHMILLPCTSPEERIAALEVLGARTAERDMTQAFVYLCRAMEERWRDPSNPVLKQAYPLPLLSHTKESSTMQELEARRSNPEELLLECLAILHRTLGLSAKLTEDRYIAYYQYLNEAGRFHDGMELKLLYWRDVEFTSAKMHCGTVFALCRNIRDTLLQAGVSPRFEHAHEVFQKWCACMVKWKEALAADPSLSKKLVLESISLLLICCRLTQNEAEEDLLEEMIQAFRELLSSCCPHNPSPLHLALLHCRSNNQELAGMTGLPLVKLIEVLVQSGAAINAKDSNGNTALHLIARYKVLGGREAQTRIVALLLKAGALPGIQNCTGSTPGDVARHPLVKSALQASLPVSLQSLAAKVILQHKIPYEPNVPDLLAKFVRIHKHQ